ncbi:uncharacterized protein LY89DRAFT_782222 [Mollisia scopiformis]|uniref:Uncharacterized protein n=1 Tax=Mollisia scopiformis TaxID=149040 RepID=A0A194XA00_MOLSC|nr:uncharacterized protein LY89DRAFT_782222 [Mollisia scopiformis]KUJ16995.1 hypothetical protein LY89DRAFT_782222 [Mollisia scopiformis]
MSGLEAIPIAALVCAIISAFTGSANLLKRVPRDKRLKYHHVGKSLDHGSEKVQNDFNRYVSRLGRRFERGDEQARQELRNVAFMLQSNLLKSVYHVLDGRNAAFGDVHELSEQGRRDAVWALGSQYQRILSAAPFARALQDGYEMATRRPVEYSQREALPPQVEERVVVRRRAREPEYTVVESRGRPSYYEVERPGRWEVVEERAFDSYDSRHSTTGWRPRSRSRSRRRSSSRSRYSVY